MPNLAQLPHTLDADVGTCRAVIEASKGSRSKYAYDSTAEVFELAGLLPEGMSYPFDFGFVPSTRAEDGDPTDIILLGDEPCPVGCLVQARLIGVIEAEQVERGTSVRNDRLIGVATVSHLFDQITAPGDLGKRFWDQQLQFWVNYNALRGRDFRILSLAGVTAAVAIVRRTQTFVSGSARFGAPG